MRGRSARAVPPWIRALAAELDGRVDEQTAWIAARCVATCVPVLVALLAGLAGGVLSLVVLLASPRMIHPLLSRRESARRDALLPEILDRLASAVRSGQALAPALVEIAHDCPDPLAEDLHPVAAAIEHGSSLEQALTSWNRAAWSRDVALVTAAIGLGVRTGGQVARALDGVAATLRERQELHAEVRALATQARASAGVLVLAPLGFAALMSTIEPAAVTFLVSSPAGLACLGVGLALEATGAFWMQRIIREAV